jgi:hypothetical protein
MSKCRSCGAEVEFVKTLAAGKLIPLDAASVEKGNIRLEGGFAVYCRAGEGDRISHFATCPQAKGWRRDGK